MARRQIELLQAMKARRPFVSFKVVTSTGATLIMVDRFQFAVGEDKAILYVEPGSSRWVALRPDDILSVEEIGEKSAA
jgi:hypothetical protein